MFYSTCNSVNSRIYAYHVGSGANGRDEETCNACAIPWLVSIEHLIGSLRAKIHVVWSTGRRYLNMDKYFERRPNRTDEDYSDEETSIVEQADRLVTVPA